MEHDNPSVSLPTDKRSTRKLGTHKTSFKVTEEFKGRVPVKVMGAEAPLGKETGGKCEGERLTKHEAEEVI